mmetsp:Transcript_43400/g.98038  ORF Transcript_43400/g.98038 Transcript_43400/m.98038 type:complete len:112 (-) Transcript_43400:327-662(-)
MPWSERSFSSTSSTLSSGCGYDDQGPYIIKFNSWGTPRYLRPGSVIFTTFGTRILKEGDCLYVDSFFSKPKFMPRSCNSPYVTPTTSPDNSPKLEASEHGGNIMPQMMLAK